MMGHFHMKAFHISSANKGVADALSRGKFQNFKELAPEADTFPTAGSSHGIFVHFKLDFVNLVENSLSENTWNVYANAEKSFEKIRKNYDLEKVWPVPISHLINFIVYLAKNSYSPNTAKSYIVAIGFKMKMNNHTDSTDSFIVKKLLKGMSKTY
jgi:hypothetical protein